jgi:glutaredoxin
MSGCEITVITRADCGLCTAAEAVVAEVAASRPVAVATVDVDADPELRAKYDWDVPVVLVDGRQVGFHRIDRARLERAVDSRLAARRA